MIAKDRDSHKKLGQIDCYNRYKIAFLDAARLNFSVSILFIAQLRPDVCSMNVWWEAARICGRMAQQGGWRTRGVTSFEGQLGINSGHTDTFLSPPAAGSYSRPKSNKK